MSSTLPPRAPLGAFPGILAILSLACAIPVQAEDMMPSLSDADRAQALQTIEHAIETGYVYPELRSAIVAKLEDSQRAHRYDGTDPALFVQRVTEDLQSVGHDGHLYLSDDPAEFAAASAPAHSDTGMDEFARAAALRDHSGLVELMVLPGNLRYLKITSFEWTPKATEQAYDDAIRFLKDGDATIIDLRGNGGGDSDAADYLLSALLPPGTLLFTTRDGATIEESRTRMHMRAGSLEGKPLYMLVDGHVGSAAESVAYAVQQNKAGIIVGSNTYGAANNNRIVPVAPRFILSYSYRRPISPVTGTNWEGTGVIPDLKVSGDRARAAAEVAALDRLSTTPGVKPAPLAEYRWARIAAEAELNPVTFDKEQLQSLAGNYGPVTLRETATGLLLSRSDRPRWQKDLPLTPLAADGTFAVQGFDDLRARVTGNTLVLLYGSEDDREEFQRTPPGM